MTRFGPRLRGFAGVFAAALMIYLLPGCRDVKLQQGETGVSMKPESLDFGFVYQGAESYLSVSVLNSSRGRVNVTWDELPEPFTTDELPRTLEVGETELTVRFRPTAWGERTATLVVREGLTVLAKLPLRGIGQNIPECPTPVACHQVHFDLAKGECVEEALADETPCDANSVCILNAACHEGRCVGEPLSCDDGNACTVDLCNPLSGCESAPAPPCPSTGACTVGVCDPQLGCVSEPAADGTVCGNVTCDAADVCISGACVNRDPPDGFRCAEASPCQSEGLCQGSSCVQPAATSLNSNWSFIASAAGTATSPAPELHDILMEPDGAMTLSGFYEKPRVRMNTALPRTLDAGVRRCILWNGRMACADHLTTGNTGTLNLIDLASGQVVWSFTLGGARPDFAAQVAPGHMFMARLAVMGPDRLLALFEAYPKGSTADTQCRIYFLVLLNAGGQMVTASKLTDPSLETCDHPHPFGVAADAAGNVFMAFSSSAAGSAPLSATTPTTLWAFTRDGALKWKRTEAFVAGELAVAKGVLFNERSNSAFNANTGAPMSLGGMSRPLGRVIATNSLFIPSPTNALQGSASTLTAWRFTGGSAWSYTLPVGETFASPEIRAVTWRSSDQLPRHTAALAFVTGSAGELKLQAIDADSGKKLWACGVNAPGASTPPQLLEVANGFIGTMDSAMSCGDCDPPFALSSGTFRSYPLKNLEQAAVPWSGTFGGAGHPHRELPVYSATPQQ